MCRRTKLYGALFVVLGIGFLLSCLVGSWFIRLLIGIAFLAIGMILNYH